MNTQKILWKLSLSFLLLVLMGGTLACQEEITGPRAWVDVPLDGSSVPAGTPVPVISHAYARDGIAEILLSVNGEAYRRNPPAQPGATFSKFSQDWIPQQPGDYVLQVKVFAKNGETSNPATVRVRAIGKVTPTPVRLVTPVITPPERAPVTPVTPVTTVPLSDLAIVSVDAMFSGYKGTTPLCRPRVVYRNAGAIPVPNDYVIQLHVNGTPQMTMTRGAGFGVGGTSEAIFDYVFEGAPYIGINLDSTNTVTESNETNNAFAEARMCSGTAAPITPTFTPTPPTPLPPSGCSGSPNIASFSASPSTITQGNSTTLSWGAVTNADSVSIEPGIGGVSTPGSRTVSPGTTTTYTLTARCGSNTQTRQTTVTVLPIVHIVTPTFTPTRTRTRTPTPDKQGPPAPHIVGPSSPNQCVTSITLNWDPVSDPSGIKNYIVKWSHDGQSGGTTTTSTQHTLSITCDNKSHTYSWSVQAEDNAGNRGGTSNAAFTIPAGLY
ncbi:MAG: hypothetical protein AB1817_01010 [Chloroflexota bacterium]